jgi:vacuolar fusion protein MON1
VNAYVQFIRRGDDTSSKEVSKQGQGSTTSDRETFEAVDNKPKPPTGEDRIQSEFSTGIGLVCVSGEADFDVIRIWGDTVTQVCLLGPWP